MQLKEDKFLAYRRDDPMDNFKEILIWKILKGEEREGFQTISGFIMMKLEKSRVREISLKAMEFLTKVVDYGLETG